MRSEMSEERTEQSSGPQAYAEAFVKAQARMKADGRDPWRALFDRRPGCFGPDAASEFDDRTTEDLLFFAENGKWPDAAEGAK
jgi:hypothetical protein